MKTCSIGNAVEVTDIDLYDDEACRELGRLVTDECVVLVRQSVPEERLYAIQTLWGQPCMPMLNRYVGERRLSGRHWRDMFVTLRHVISPLDDAMDRPGMCRVSFERDEKGHKTGIFPEGKLDWHADQQGYHDSQRIVGLMSLWGSESSQTAFLCTAPAYEALNHDDRSMVDELVSVWSWDGGVAVSELDDGHLQMFRYNMVPIDGMETALAGQTATGLTGIHYPAHCFSHFRGMGVEESARFRRHLWQQLDRPEHVFVHDWKDGEIVFMDQNITLHARPTDVTASHTRTMTRMISYVDRLFPDHAPADFVLYQGERYDHDRFAQLVDAKRKAEFEAARAMAT